MLRSLIVMAAFLLGSCASPDATTVVDGLTQLETNYDESRAAADALVAKATGIDEVTRTKWAARAATLDEQSQELFDRLREIVSEWGKVDWREVAKKGVGLVREARGR